MAGYRRIGHKGADAITPGNRLESFVVAAELGVDMVELDVLHTREGVLVVAHDHGDLRGRRPMLLTEALDAFLRPPLDEVEIDCDLKLPGREAELAGQLVGRGLLERAMVSSMEQESLVKLRAIEPDLRLGWTFPKTQRDWTRYRWARLGVQGGIAALRARLPRLLARRAPELGVNALWAYHALVSARLIEVARDHAVEVIAWTVDEAERVAELRAIGVHGICSNDPRLFEAAESIAVERGMDVPATGGTEAAVEEDIPSEKQAAAAIDREAEEDGVAGDGAAPDGAASEASTGRQSEARTG